jgi:hypothetical protein
MQLACLTPGSLSRNDFAATDTVVTVLLQTRYAPDPAQWHARGQGPERAV